MPPLEPNGYFNNKGRATDLPSVAVGFKKLQEGTDFSIVHRNKEIGSKFDLSQYVVFVNQNDADQVLDVTAPHWRSITIPNQNIIFDYNGTNGEKKQSHFHEVNVKGVGFLQPFAYGQHLDDFDTWIKTNAQGEYSETNPQVLGLDSRDQLTKENLVVLSKYFNTQGIRSELYWGVVKLKKLYYKGELVDVSTLRNMGVIPKKFALHPHIGVRLMRTNTRVSEIFNDDEVSRDKFSHKLPEMIKIMQEEGWEMGETGAFQAYGEWYAKRMGENIGRLFSIGYHHGQLHTSNITMAAEIVDIGPSFEDKTLSAQEKSDLHGLSYYYIKDLRDVLLTIKKLIKKLQSEDITINKKLIVKQFVDGVSESFNQEQANKNSDITKEGLLKWVSGLSQGAIIQGKNLPSLKRIESVSELPITL